jgi:hypothetical protein
MAATHRMVESDNWAFAAGSRSPVATSRLILSRAGASAQNVDPVATAAASGHRLLQPEAEYGMKEGAGGTLELGNQKSEEGWGMIKRRRMNGRRSGDEDLARIEAARKGRGSPAVANAFRSHLIKSFSFLHLQSNPTLMIEFETRRSIHCHLSASVMNPLIFHTSIFPLLRYTVEIMQDIRR